MEDVDDSSEESCQNPCRSQCLAGPGPVDQGADCGDGNSWVYHVESCWKLYRCERGVRVLMPCQHDNNRVVKKKKKKVLLYGHVQLRGLVGVTVTVGLPVLQLRSDIA